MHNAPSHNFAARLFERLSENSSLVEAASGNTLTAAEIRTQIAGFAARFRSIGLHAGDRVLLSCGINPASSLAYFGAMYAGLVPVLLDERTHAASGHSVNAKVGAKAVWSAKPIRPDWAIQADVHILEGGCTPADPTS